MKLDQLTYLIELSKHTSMRQASEKLFITPQALNLSIQALENELNTQILLRSNQGISFTENGKKVLKFAEQTLKEYDKLHSSIRTESTNQDSSLKGTLTIYSNKYFLAFHLPNIVKNFTEAYPNIRVSVIASYNKSTFNKMSTDNNKDVLGIVNLHSFPDRSPSHLPSNLYFQNIYTGNYRVFCNKDSTLANHKQISLSTLSQHPLIIYTSNDNNSVFCKYLLETHKNANIFLKTNSLDMIFYALEQDLGAVILYDMLINEPSLQDRLNQFSVIKIKEKITAQLGYIYEKDNTTPIVQAFLKFLPDKL